MSRPEAHELWDGQLLPTALWRDVARGAPSYSKGEEAHYVGSEALDPKKNAGVLKTHVHVVNLCEGSA